MHLKLDWKEPVPLREVARSGLVYRVDFDALPSEAGVYVFARRWADSYEALYVGRSRNVRRRIGAQLGNRLLMAHLRKAKTGRRVVFAGEAMTRSGQRLDRVLRTLKRALIRHFLAAGHDLVNTQGVRIRRHEIASEGAAPRSFVPSLMYLEKSRRR